jgi:hypothetical protein
MLTKKVNLMGSGSWNIVTLSAHTGTNVAKGLTSLMRIIFAAHILIILLIIIIMTPWV